MKDYLRFAAFGAFMGAGTTSFGTILFRRFSDPDMTDTRFLLENWFLFGVFFASFVGWIIIFERRQGQR